ncbi:iron-hydroxamate ABC transporter substrate-binding protein [Alkalicoccus daliensis]|uniref:Iron complex transport system substrate-binding protein n=1 Tax=Alkalicoccus daliensis TaxID=745820 RepID=A0A1H0HTQ6_9BACI|nr:iron-hydroxamate ABC transporter substrate-binding protein [Alkalicoccus daliensis]SDO22592.1 iron complex transport system substrate-binding protein [Alkalicoccus daliensis]
MKRTIMVTTLSLLALSMTACGDSGSNAADNNGTADNNSVNVNNAADENTNEEAASNNEDANAEENESSSDTIVYESENGPVEVPADPQRVAVLSTFAGNVMALDVPLVGVDSWSMNNPQFEEQLEGVEEVTDESLEKLIELEPDLILGLNNINNVEQLEEIAPVVTFEYGAVDYLEQHIEIGKVLNKEEEASAWVNDFREEASALGEEIKAEIGEDATISVFENFDKQLYVFGDNWGRGTEILYQEMEIGMPEKVEEMALEEGYYALSAEVLPEFAGDYMVFSKVADTDNSFQETETYQNIPAVAEGNVIEVDAMSFYFNDPVTLEYQLDVFEEEFLK